MKCLFTKYQILSNIITELELIPLPLDGKTVGIGEYKIQMEEAFRLARLVKWAETQKEMNIQFLRFKRHCDNCK